MPFKQKSPVQLGSDLVQYAGFGEFQDPQIIPTITNGSMSLAIDPNNPGDFYTSAPAITITDRGTGASTSPPTTVAATFGTVGYSGGSITSVPISQAGHFYTAPMAVSFTVTYSSAGVSAVATANPSTITGGITSVTITNAGTFYTAAPSATIAAPPPNVTAVATALLGNGYVIASTFTSTQPNGYSAAPAVSFTGGGGSGAAASAVIDAVSGNLLRIQITNPGNNYTSAPTMALTTSGGLNTATATAVIAAQVISLGSVAGFGFTSVPYISVAAPQAVLLSVNQPYRGIAGLTGLFPLGGIVSTTDLLQWVLPTLTKEGTTTYGQKMTTSQTNSLIVVTRTASTLTRGLNFAAAWQTH